MGHQMLCAKIPIVMSMINSVCVIFSVSAILAVWPFAVEVEFGGTFIKFTNFAFRLFRIQ